MFDLNFGREGGLMDGVYYNKTITVLGGVTLQLVDIHAALTSAGRDAPIGPARYLYIQTDVAITVRINDTTLDPISVTSTAPLTIPLNLMAISRVYLSHTGACGAGAASVVIFAS